MTEKLFYADAHMRKFTARVLSCDVRGGRFAVTLDRTAFFPEGGGQGGDTGALGGVLGLAAVKGLTGKKKQDDDENGKGEQ